MSVALVRGLVGALRARNIDVEPVLRELSVDARDLADARITVSLGAFERGLSAALRVAPQSALGLWSALATPLDGLLGIGPLFAVSADLGAALSRLARFGPLLGAWWSMASSPEPGRAFTFAIQARRPSTLLFTSEFIAALAYRLIGSHLAPAERALLRVSVPHGAPAQREAYEAAFACPVQFGASRGLIALPENLLTRPNPHADYIADTALGEYLDARLLDHRGVSVAERARYAIQYGLVRDRLDVASLARAVGVSARGLRRQLYAEGTSVSALIDEQRAERARSMLRDGATTIQEVSIELGFSEPAAFHRAFKRWTGQTPGEYARGATRAVETPRARPEETSPGA